MSMLGEDSEEDGEANQDDTPKLIMRNRGKEGVPSTVEAEAFVYSY